MSLRAATRASRTSGFAGAAAAAANSSAVRLGKVERVIERREFSAMLGCGVQVAA
jgi:hypothetical protein